MSTMPDARGRFGDFGGRFVPETVMGALDELLAAWEAAWSDPAFHERLDLLARDYVGRPSPLYRAERLEELANGARVYLKREDLNHTGAHKINNAVGQALLAVRLGKRRIVAETGAGQHGVASATVCARFGLDCHVYMGEEDIRRQHPNVVRMGMLGAEVIPVTAGAGTLKDGSTVVTAGSTDWYVAVEPDRVGAGRVIGNDSASERPPLVMVASGPPPPPDRVRPAVVTVGEMLPSALRRNVASNPAQDEPTRLRTATADRVRVNVPFGLATRVSVAVVAPSTGTAFPVALAWAWACVAVSTGVFVVGVVGAVGVCAGAADQAPVALVTTTVVTAVTATQASRRRRTNVRIFPRFQVSNRYRLGRSQENSRPGIVGGRCPVDSTASIDLWANPAGFHAPIVIGPRSRSGAAKIVRTVRGVHPTGNAYHRVRPPRPDSRRPRRDHPDGVRIDAR